MILNDLAAEDKAINPITSPCTPWRFNIKDYGEVKSIVVVPESLKQLVIVKL